MAETFMAKQRKVEEPGSALEQADETATDTGTPAADDPVAAAPAAAEVVEPPLLPAYTPHHSTSERPETALPDASEVDTTKIKSAVLTKQGWVLPSSLEERANH